MSNRKCRCACGNTNNNCCDNRRNYPVADAVEDAYNQGHNDGFCLGIKQGRKEGYCEGYEDGLLEGSKNSLDCTVEIECC